MNNYDELEKLYYKKKLKKYLFYSFIFIAISFIGFFIYKEINKHIKTEQISNHIKIKTIQPKSKLKNKKEIKNKLTLNPMIPKINDFKITKPKVTKPQKHQKVEKKPIKKQIPKIIQPPKPKIIIKVSENSDNSLSNLINNFSLLKDYSIAIKIAEIYFNHKKYNKTIEWAKKANEINSEDERSWLLYAKSLVQLGKINKAKELLQAYLQNYDKNEKITQYLRSLNERKHTKKN